MRAKVTTTVLILKETNKKNTGNWIYAYIILNRENVKIILGRQRYIF